MDAENLAFIGRRVKISAYLAFLDEGGEIEGLSPVDQEFEVGDHAPIELTLLAIRATIEAHLEHPLETMILFRIDEKEETLH